MEWCFPARFRTEGRSERDASIGVLFGQNGGSRKTSLEKGTCDRVFQRWLWLPCGFVTTITQPECDTVIGWIVGIDHTANPNPSILKLFYGFDTILGEKEYSDSHKITKEVTYIFTI